MPFWSLTFRKVPCILDFKIHMFYILKNIRDQNLMSNGWGRDRGPGRVWTVGLSVRLAWDMGQKYQQKRVGGRRKDESPSPSYLSSSWRQGLNLEQEVLEPEVHPSLPAPPSLPSPDSSLDLLQSQWQIGRDGTCRVQEHRRRGSGSEHRREWREWNRSGFCFSPPLPQFILQLLPLHPPRSTGLAGRCALAKKVALSAVWSEAMSQSPCSQSCKLGPMHSMRPLFGYSIGLEGWRQNAPSSFDRDAKFVLPHPSGEHWVICQPGPNIFKWNLL